MLVKLNYMVLKSKVACSIIAKEGQSGVRFQRKKDYSEIAKEEHDTGHFISIWGNKGVKSRNITFSLPLQLF